MCPHPSSYTYNAGVDPRFEIGGAQNVRVSVRKFFSVPHSLSSPQPGLGTLEL